MIAQKNRTNSIPLTKEMVSKNNGNVSKKDKAYILVPKGAPAHLLEKFKKNLVKRDEYVEYAARGAKAQSLAEIAQVVKWLSVTDPKGAFEMMAKDFKAAYGGEKEDLRAANILTKVYLKKFGIKEPRIAQTKQFINGDTVDVVQIWSPVPVEA